MGLPAKGVIYTLQGAIGAEPIDWFIIYDLIYPLTHVTTNSTSNYNLSKPRSRLKSRGDRAFAVVGPRL